MLAELCQGQREEQSHAHLYRIWKGRGKKKHPSFFTKRTDIASEIEKSPEEAGTSRTNNCGKFGEEGLELLKQEMTCDFQRRNKTFLLYQESEDWGVVL